MGETTNLNRAFSGNTKAGTEGFPAIYEELRKLARARLANQPPNQTLQATALVHEAWIRLSRQPDRCKPWKNQRHFFATAAESMRHILIESARRRSAKKRGSGKTPDPFEESRIVVQAEDDELLAVHDGLDLLAQESPEAAEVVKLRYFIGMTTPEIAATLETSTRTVDRLWAFARAWLKDHLLHP